MNWPGTYIIAEAGVNHNGQRALAFELIDAAAEAGVDAVKFQTFDSAKLASNATPKASYQKKYTSESESQLAMLKSLELPRAWHKKLQQHAQSKGVEFLSTAFDSESLEFLTTLDLPLFKVPSGELTNGKLLWRFAQTGKRLLLSTGMATLSEVELALAVVAHSINNDREPKSLEEVWQAWSNSEWRRSLKGRIVLLHCTSQYPTPFEEVNLRAMDTLAHSFSLEVGYSDHTEGTLIPIAAVARGARVIEKHFTLDRKLPGPDHRASLEPPQLKEMVESIRSLSLALGDGMKAPQASEWDTRLAARQQIVASQAIEAGESFSSKNLDTKRCGEGIPASEIWDIIGRQSHRTYNAGDVISR